MATPKQEAVDRKLVENRGKSISSAMREVGYSPKTAKNPKNLTNSKGWEALMKQYLPEKKLAKAHDELLQSNYLEHIDFSGTMTNQQIKRLLAGITGASLKTIQAVNVPFKGKLKRAYVLLFNEKARKEALELAYKLQGKFAPERIVDESAREKIDNLSNRLKDLIGAK